MLGYSGDNYIDGGLGDDFIRNGGGGADTLIGGEGADTFKIGIISGTPGNTLGDATITGGELDSEIDVVDFNNHDTAINVVYTGDEEAIFDDNANSGEFSGIEGVRGTEFNGTIDSTLDSVGMIVDAEGGNDSLFGGAGGDTLAGADGNDTIDGGAGNDTFTGGDGSDIFIADGSADTITDFDALTGIETGIAADQDALNSYQYL